MTRTKAIEAAKLLKHINDLSDVAKILDTFLNAFVKYSIIDKDGNAWLHGNYNLNGAKSGRLSSSNPNLTNLPSGSRYGAAVKKCFMAPPGYVFGGADFSSLESVVNALITKDTNKLRPLIEQIDSHSFNTYSYWKDKFKHIPNTKEGINSIKTEYSKDRSKSKPVTFALQYMGSWYTLVVNSGFSKEEAQAIEANYLELYKQSVAWLKGHLEEATHSGFVTGAFGLRLRTPLLAKTLFNVSVSPREAGNEGRTAGNMLSGQSYSLLNNRAANEFLERVSRSVYKYDIHVVALIHDAIYIVFPANVGCTKWVNDNLIECMQWDDLPELKHDVVKLGAEVDLFIPSWNDPITLKNNISNKEILDTVNKSLENNNE